MRGGTHDREVGRMGREELSLLYALNPHTGQKRNRKKRVCRKEIRKEKWQGPQRPRQIESPTEFEERKEKEKKKNAMDFITPIPNGNGSGNSNGNSDPLHRARGNQETPMTQMELANTEKKLHPFFQSQKIPRTGQL